MHTEVARLELPDQFRSNIPRAVRDHHRRSGLGDAGDDSGANAASATGHQRYSSRQVERS